jgi:4-coumarate--CoA ligase
VTLRLCFTTPSFPLLTQIFDNSNNDERPRAYVVLTPGQSATADDITKFIENKVSAFKRITGGVVFLDAIPKNPSGKILRVKLREQAKEELKGATAKL